MATLIDLTGTIVDADESSDITVSFVDLIDGDLETADLLSLTFSLVTHEIPATVINSRSDINILNADAGTLTDVDGKAVLTLRLDAADNPIVGTPELGECEDHEIQLQWTWNDGVKVRNGRATLITRIKPRAV